jgi:hypothetical protein
VERTTTLQHETCFSHVVDYASRKLQRMGHGERDRSSVKVVIPLLEIHEFYLKLALSYLAWEIDSYQFCIYGKEELRRSQSVATVHTRIIQLILRTARDPALSYSVDSPLSLEQCLTPDSLSKARNEARRNSHKQKHSIKEENPLDSLLNPIALGWRSRARKQEIRVD